MSGNCFGWWPSDGCCGSCTIFSDDFTANDIASWTQAVTSWSISGGVLTTSSSGAPLLIANTANTTGRGRVIVVGGVDRSAARIRAVGAYTNNNNYVFADVTINGSSSQFAVYQYVGGSLSQIGDTQTFTGSTGTSYTIELCWDGTVVDALVSASGVPNIAGACSLNGNQAGVGATPSDGTGGTGTATFTSFKFLKHHSDDSSCNSCGSGQDGGVTSSGHNIVTAGACSGTPSCTSSLVSRYMKVVLAGGTSGVCDSCASILGTYILTYVPPTDMADNTSILGNPVCGGSDLKSGFSCMFEWDIPNAVFFSQNCVAPCAGTASLRVLVKLYALKFHDGTWRWALWYHSDLACDGNTVLFVSADQGGPFDCTNIDGVVMNYQGNAVLADCTKIDCIPTGTATAFSL